MQIELVPIKRNTDRAGLFILQNTALASPFHAYHSTEYLAVYEAYKAYLFRTLQNLGSPQDIAIALSQESNLMISQRWEAPSYEDIKAQVAQLVQLETLKIAVSREHDPAEALAAYLSWRTQPASLAPVA